MFFAIVATQPCMKRNPREKSSQHEAISGTQEVYTMPATIWSGICVDKSYEILCRFRFLVLLNQKTKTNTLNPQDNTKTNTTNPQHKTKTNTTNPQHKTTRSTFNPRHKTKGKRHKTKGKTKAKTQAKNRS